MFHPKLFENRNVVVTGGERYRPRGGAAISRLWGESAGALSAAAPTAICLISC